MSTVFFIRHAETDMAGRFCGHSDPDLNARGHAQLAELVQQFSGEARQYSVKRISLVVSSDLRRAASTAHAIAHASSARLELRPALREIHFGEWEGLSWEQIEQRDAAYAGQWVTAFPQLAAPQGETFPAFEARVLSALRSVTENNDDSIAVVTHAGVLRVVSQHLFGCAEPWKEAQPYCGVLRYESKGLEVTGENR